jgi:hypothetical protein
VRRPGRRLLLLLLLLLLRVLIGTAQPVRISQAVGGLLILKAFAAAARR